jgi:hypothetical protein
VTVYFQHVGEAGGRRDFPRTIGTPKMGLRTFAFSDIEQHLIGFAETDKEKLSNQLDRYAPDGFQIWGIPSGAKRILRSVEVGDFLLLLESVGPGGRFAYGGRIVGYHKGSRSSFLCTFGGKHVFRSLFSYEGS